MSFIENNFHFFSADTNQILQLKQLVLQLAVKGALVSQDPNDEPATELLKRIKAEKQYLIKSGDLGKEKALPKLSAEEMGFELPVGWVWCRFGEITYNRDAGRIPLSKEERSTRTGRFDYYGASGVIDKIDDFLFDKTLLLIGEDGANLINRSTPIAFIAKGQFWVNNHAHVIDGISIEFLEFMCIYINAIDLRPYITGTAQPKMNQAKMNSIIVPLPLPEQHRIVQKVNTLFRQIDRLAEQSRRSEATRQRLRAALLHRLEQAEGRSGAETAWQSLSQQFDLAIRTRQDVQALCQTILQLAVKGALAPQDPNDEPATELLKRIKAEKQRLIKAGEIGKEKPLPEVSVEEMGFELPRGWVFTSLQEIGEINPRNKFDDESYSSFVPMTLISEKYGVAPGYEKKKWKEIKNGYTHFKEGDVVIAKITPCFENSKAAIMSNLINGIGAGTTELHVFRRISQNVLPEYVYIFFKSSLILKNGEPRMTGSAGQKRVPKDFIAYFPFPLPPLPEQHRIVQKVEALMRWCDMLEAGLERLAEVEGRLVGAALRV